jgi:nondiscriminating glutamyl-tRNA synthetase
MENQPIRVRFAPSPTGSLHLGGARTALYNMLFARKYNGTFVLRIEDTDVARNTPEALKSQLFDLQWLGLNWDEGPDAETLSDKGPYGPYRQSLRLKHYQATAEKLLEKGLAYYCFLSDEAITAQKEAAVKAKTPYQIVSPYRDLPLDESLAKIKQGEAATIRLKTPKTLKKYIFNDIIRGEITFPSNMVGDFVIMRASGMPVYNFSCVVDDLHMKISHVFRGEEHLSNTLRQLMLYEALEGTPPAFGHLSVILGPNRKKLSKRDAAVSCADFRSAGYLPDAINNGVALLGWTDPEGKDIFTLEDLSQVFSEKDLNAASPIFDRQKLDWISNQHIRMMPKDVLLTRIKPALDALGLPQELAWRTQALELVIHDLITLNHAKKAFQIFSNQDYQLHSDAKVLLKEPNTTIIAESLKALIEKETSDRLSPEAFRDWIAHLKTDHGLKGKALFMPIRVCLSGALHGPDLTTLATLIPRRLLRDRVNLCLAPSK